MNASSISKELRSIGILPVDYDLPVDYVALKTFPPAGVSKLMNDSAVPWVALAQCNYVSCPEVASGRSDPPKSTRIKYFKSPAAAPESLDGLLIFGVAEAVKAFEGSHSSLEMLDAFRYEIARKP